MASALAAAAGSSATGSTDPGRVRPGPFADTSLYRVPRGRQRRAGAVRGRHPADGYEVGVLKGGVKPGDTVAIVGAGPVGLATIMTAKLLHARVRSSPSTSRTRRLERALKFGADVVVNNGAEDAVAMVMDITGGLGADVAIEAVGVPAPSTSARADPPGGRSRTSACTGPA